LNPPRCGSWDPAGRITPPGRAEVAMRIGAVVLVIWLVIGAIAAGQRGYYRSENASCAKAGTIVLTIAAGPLNYIGANPKVNCKVPQPSQ
jgi:hypothetical protein